MCLCVSETATSYGDDLCLVKIQQLLKGISIKNRFKTAPDVIEPKALLTIFDNLFKQRLYLINIIITQSI